MQGRSSSDAGHHRQVSDGQSGAVQETSVVVTSDVGKKDSAEQRSPAKPSLSEKNSLIERERKPGIKVMGLTPSPELVAISMGKPCSSAKTLPL